MEEKLRKIFAYVQERGFQLERIERAYEIAERLHAKQIRKSGEPYISHLIAVTAYLTEYQADEDSLVAGFLHDTVEDTEYTLEDVEKDFGPNVAKLIHGMTKFSKTHFQEEATLDRKIESLRKWFEVMQEDIRVGVIKLFDRLHNIETLNYHGNATKELAIAKETLDIHVKVAKNLGLYEVRAELERLCLPYTDPQNAELFDHIRHTEKETCEVLLPKIQHRIEGQDTDDRILEIKHRPLSLSDIYEFGLHAKENLEGNIPLIITITTSTIKDCYYVLYLLHGIWQAERGSFEDFINTPAMSGYRGLHTKVLLAGGREVLFKVMTKEMEDYRKYGVTKYCFQTDTPNSYHKLPEWISRIAHVTKADRHNSESFWEQFQNDILAESITIYTDQGNSTTSLFLPSHATALDAAFFAYGEQGLYIANIFVNGRKVPLYHHLSAKDTVTFQFGFTLTVSYEWVQFVNTEPALSYVREGLKAHDNISKIRQGQEILQEALFREGRGLWEEVEHKRSDQLLAHFSLNSIDELFQLIAEGEILPERVVEFLYPRTRLKALTDQKTIKAQGSFAAITGLFERIPANFKEKLRWSIRSSRRTCQVTCIASGLTSRQWRQLIQYFESTSGVDILVKSTSWDYRKIFLYVPLINILLGLDPLVASQLLTHISPQILTLIRFVSTSFFLYGFIIFATPYRKNVRNIPFFHPIIIILAFLITAAAFGTYQALSTGTQASSYLLLMQVIPWLMLLAYSSHQRPLALPRMLSSAFIMVVGLLSFFMIQEWSTTAKLWTVGVMCAYVFYIYIQSYFRRKEKVEIRKYQMLLFISIYASIITILGLFVIPTNFSFSPGVLIAAIIYSLLCTCLPAILHAKLLKQFQSSLQVEAMKLNWAFAIGFVSEIIFLQLTPSIEKTLAIVAIYSALFLLIPLFRRQPV